MSITLTEARDGFEARVAALSIPAKTSIETEGQEVVLTITDIPFIQHGMEFRSPLKFHFTLDLREDGRLRTYWGKHDWAGKGADRKPCRTENAAETHDELAPALDWIAARIGERVQLK